MVTKQVSQNDVLFSALGAENRSNVVILPETKGYLELI